MKIKISGKNIAFLTGIVLMPIIAVLAIPDARFHISWWAISPGDDATFAVAVLGDPDSIGGVRRKGSELKTLEVSYSWRRRWLAYNISFRAGQDPENLNLITAKRCHLISRENY